MGNICKLLAMAQKLVEHQQRDTFTTQAYKGGYIHTCQNRTKGREEINAVLPDGSRRYAKSIRAAKILISRSN